MARVKSTALACLYSLVCVAKTWLMTAKWSVPLMPVSGSGYHDGGPKAASALAAIRVSMQHGRIAIPALLAVSLTYTTLPKKNAVALPHRCYYQNVDGWLRGWLSLLANWRAWHDEA